MKEFSKKIIKARKDIKKIYEQLDIINTEVLEEFEKHIARLKNEKITKTDPIINKIQERMIKISKLPQSDITDAVLNELSSILDWIDDEE